LCRWRKLKFGINTTFTNNNVAFIYRVTVYLKSFVGGCGYDQFGIDKKYFSVWGYIMNYALLSRLWVISDFLVIIY